MLTLDESGRVLAMTRGAETLFGYDAKEVTGESFLTLFAPHSQSDAAARFERVSSRGEAGFQDRVLSAMRFQFGGHVEKSAK